MSRAEHASCPGWASTTSGLEASEDVHKEAIQHVQDLIVMLIYLHLQVQSSEFTKVSMCVGVLSPAYKPHPLHQMRLDARGWEDGEEVTNAG